MINRRTMLKTVAVGAAQAVALPYLAREGFAQAPAHTLKLTFADTRNHPLYQVLLRFADNVKKKTDGAIEVQVFSTGELGRQTNILTGLQTGIIDLCAHTSGYVDTLFPQFQVMDLPFLFPDLVTAEKVLDGPVGRQLADLMPAKGIYGLSYGYWEARDVDHRPQGAKPFGHEGIEDPRAAGSDLRRHVSGAGRQSNRNRLQRNLSRAITAYHRGNRNADHRVAVGQAL